MLVRDGRTVHYFVVGAKNGCGSSCSYRKCFVGSPSDLTCQGALEELLAKQGYAGDSAAVAPLDVDRVALPLLGSVQFPCRRRRERSDGLFPSGL